MRVYGVIGGQAGKEVLLGSANFDLSQYVGKINEEVILSLYGGPIESGKIKLLLSIVTIPKSKQVGIDPMELIDGVPSSMKDQIKSEIEA